MSGSWSELTFVIVGIDQWEEYTLPLLRSIRQHHPQGAVVVVDNRSEEAYPHLEGVLTLHTTQRLGYAAALNFGWDYAEGPWTILMNNDCLVNGEVKSSLKKLLNSTLYGPQFNSTNLNGTSITYLEGWLFLVSDRVRQTLGAFDPLFQVAGFEDVDYCWRARQAGIALGKVELPITHLKAGTRAALAGYPEIRKKNREYFEEKHFA